MTETEKKYPPLSIDRIIHNMNMIYMDLVLNKYYHVYDVIWIDDRAYYTGVTCIIMAFILLLIYLFIGAILPDEVKKSI